ncbi:MAG: TetR/AcrR family transcriptional regulator [Deltaproteobacteria bacterium]|jgi:AcrR family transcriptional regulator|nr:TetR/AcrR family transcriptional regulator [Deltaproteobacteria bacterium]MBT4642128.1 TetR/AcrR family transcriptional regulator [Deltaproteobacteria bacterium]MBT6499431.1 TetR/AcrR family transcriptional regulator [Deltaproteobacteria bacterium]MBT6616395.1 TetR/AcrR family transcriptional regulator [Deltaproteobacteria bacterium]MBT7154966.1 TetR/AcrR family transcriptional regulator [Deltaproteobacteria bacterium]
MKKKRLTAEQRKLSIIEATIKVVARLNYDRATTALIAKEAKINQALIYNHFESKQALQLSMLDHIRQTMSDNYETNPALSRRTQESSFLWAITVQFHSNLTAEEQQRSCVLKAMVAIDENIRKKAWEIVREDQEYIRTCLEQDYKTKFKDVQSDFEMMSWSVFAYNLLFTSLSIMGQADHIPKEKIYKSVQDFEKLILPDE